MYAKCESKFEAQRVFNSMMHHNVVSWNAIIFGYAEHGCYQLILQLFAQMQDEGFTPNARTYVAALKACASFAPEEKAKQVVQKLVKIECLEKGMAIHSQLAKGGYELNVFVANTLVDMYAKCGSMVHALLVFDRMLLPTVVSWSAVVFGFAESGENEVALEIFACMQDEGFRPNDRTYVAVLKACANCATQEEGKQIEGKLVKIKFLEKGMAFHSQLAKETHEDIFVSSTLVDMYAKCGAMLQAWQIFDRMTHPNIVSWNAMIFGYAESGESKLALLFFKYMQDYSLTPDTLTYLVMLKACGNLAALESGKKIHVQVYNSGLQNDTLVATGLVGFYGKCGSMDNAEQVFDCMIKRDLVAWGTLLAGYAVQGKAEHVLNLFESMQSECGQADEISFLSVLSACSHAGLVDKAKEYFEAMRLNHMMSPSIELYACMVGLLGRANCLDDAMLMVEGMPFNPNLSIWRTILGACRKWKNVAVGRLAFESILTLDDRDALAYVLMADIYADSGMQEECAKIEAMRVNIVGEHKSCGQSKQGPQLGLENVLITLEHGHIPSLDSGSARRYLTV